MKTTIMILLITCCGIAAAQEEKSRARHTGGFGHFAGSYETVELGALNTMLKTYGYNELPESMLSFGGGGAFVIRNFVIAMGGASLSGYQGSTDSTIISMSGGYGYLGGGYLISPGKRSFFYPNIGAGAGGFTMQLGKKGATPDFQDQLTLPRGRFQTGAGGAFINAQLAWQIMLGTGTKQGWSVGVKAGYRMSAGKWVMDVNGEDARNSPSVNLNGYYITLTLGGGGLAVR